MKFKTVAALLVDCGHISAHVFRRGPRGLRSHEGDHVRELFPCQRGCKRRPVECLSNAWTNRWVPYGHHTKLARYLCSLIASDGSGCVNAAADGCRIDWLLLGFGLSAL